MTVHGIQFCDPFSVVRYIIIVLDQFDGLVFFINSISPDGRRLKEVFISDERSPEMSKTIVAEEGLLLPQPAGKRIDLRLFRGSIVRVDEEMRSTQTIKFQSYDFDLDLQSFATGSKTFYKDKHHLTMRELRKALKLFKTQPDIYYVLLIEYHWRLSLPFACLVLGFLAAPVSVQTGSDSRLTGVVTGLILFLLYYVLTSAATALGQDGALPPAIGLWLPNFIFGALTIIMWVKTARESQIKAVTIFRKIGKSLLSRFKGRRQCDPP